MFKGQAASIGFNHRSQLVVKVGDVGCTPQVLKVTIPFLGRCCLFPWDRMKHQKHQALNWAPGIGHLGVGPAYQWQPCFEVGSSFSGRS